MRTSNPPSRVLYRFCLRLQFPMLAALLCTSATVLYKTWDVIYFPEVHVLTAILAQKQNAPVAGFTMPRKHITSEDQPADSIPNRKLSPSSRTSLDFPLQSFVHNDVQPPKLFEHRRSYPSPAEAIRAPPKLSERHRSYPSATEAIRAPPKLSERHRSYPSAAEAIRAPPKLSERRRSLLIFGADRSGTTFITKMFAGDPQMFTVYEPLWITSRWVKEKNEQLPNWKRNVMDVLKGILGCKFAESEAGTRFLSHTSTKWSGIHFRNPFISPAFCVNKTCKDLSSDPGFADDICLTKYKHSVTKISQLRTPDSAISSFLPALFLENPETDIRVIQLVRDPRGSFNSLIKLHWMADHRSLYFPIRVTKECSLLADNIKFGRSLAKWQERYLEVNYRDLASKPVEATKLMYKFAGFEMPERVREWVVRNTSPSKEELLKAQNRNAWVYSPVRNSTANVDKWKRELPIENVRIIEKLCGETLDLLGLAKITSTADK